MNINQKLAYINELIDFFPNIKYKEDRDYLNKVDMYIRKIFGENSHYLDKLKNISFSPRVFVISSNYDNEKYFEEAWKKGMVELNSLLKIMKSDLEIDMEIDNKKKSLDCMLLYPFGEKFSNIRDYLFQNLNNLSLNFFSKDSDIYRNTLIHKGEDIHNSILSNIKKMDIIIADISTSNTNIIYEIGFAHGLKKPVIIISQNIPNKISMLNGYNILIYDIENLDKLVRFLKDRIISILSSKSRISPDSPNVRWG